MNNETYSIATALLRRRKTTKILANVEQPARLPRETCDRYDAIVREALAAAGWAPFHFSRQWQGLSEPWRATILWQDACRTLAANFTHWFHDVKPGNKLPAMLSACGALVLVTVIPNHAEEIPDSTKLEQVNFEHTLAVGGMIQSLLIALEAAGLPTYWSSGGQLGSPESFRRLNIASQERLAGAVFVGYPVDDYASCEQLPGGNRSKRSPADQWTREFTDLPRV